jgi:hypothetical protein
MLKNVYEETHQLKQFQFMQNVLAYVINLLAKLLNKTVRITEGTNI